MQRQKILVLSIEKDYNALKTDRNSEIEIQSKEKKYRIFDKDGKPCVSLLSGSTLQKNLIFCN